MLIISNWNRNTSLLLLIFHPGFMTIHQGLDQVLHKKSDQYLETGSSCQSQILHECHLCVLKVSAA